MADEQKTASGESAKELADALGKLNQQQVEMITKGMEASMKVFEPLSKASIDLTTSVLEAFTKAMQDFASSIAPKGRC